MGVVSIVLALLLSWDIFAEDSPPSLPEDSPHQTEGQDREEALEDIPSCEEGNLEKCYELGNEEYESGSIDDAKDILGDACNNGFMKACSGLGFILEKEGDTAQARGHYSWACEQGFPRACTHLSRLFPVLPLKRQVASADTKKEGINSDIYHRAIDIFGKTCRRFYRSNQTIFSGGRVGSADLEKTCKEGQYMDCLRLANEKSLGGKDEEAKKLYRRSLLSGLKMAVDRLGPMVEADNGDEAVKLYTGACDEGYTRSCLRLGILEGKRGNTQKAEKILEKSCNKDSLACACVVLGKMKEEAKETALAVDFYLKGCKGGSDESCKEFLRLNASKKMFNAKAGGT